MLFNILKLFGLDIPAKIEAVKASLELRVEQATDHVKQVAQHGDVPDAQLVCLSYFGSTAKPAHVRYQIRRFKRALPQARFLACFWMLGGDPAKVEDWKVAVGADFVATSLDQAALICAREMRDTSAVSIPILRKVGTA